MLRLANVLCSLLKEADFSRRRAPTANKARVSESRVRRERCLKRFCDAVFDDVFSLSRSNALFTASGRPNPVFLTYHPDGERVKNILTPVVTCANDLWVHYSKPESPYGDVDRSRGGSVRGGMSPNESGWASDQDQEDAKLFGVTVYKAYLFLSFYNSATVSMCGFRNRTDILTFLWVFVSRFIPGTACVFLLV